MTEHKLIAYYEQTLDASEQQEVKLWIAESDAHQKIYEDTVRIWESARIPASYTLYNKERAWEKLQQQLNPEPAPATAKAGVIALNWRKGLAIAASVAVLMVLFFLINTPSPQQFTAQKEQRTVELKDQSKVTLYEAASLEVDGNFNRKTRTVTLRGNAYFDIAKNPGKPFIIHNNDMQVEVLGTSFTIQQGKEVNTVFVHSGKVKASLGQQSVVAVARQKIVQYHHSRRLEVLPLHSNISDALHAQVIRIKDMRVDSLAQMLNDLYNVQLELAPGIESKKVTSTYLIQSETAEQIIENIALMINAKWTKKNNNQYLIYK